MQAGFTVGDKAYYPVHGVAEVVALEQRDYGGKPASVYVLKILESGLKIMVPVANADTVGLRPLLKPAETKEIYGILRSKGMSSENQTWNRRHREYMDKIKSGSVYEIAEVLRDLSLLKFEKELSFGERKMMDTARTLLVKELAIAQGLSEEEVLKEIQKIFKS